MAFPIDCRRTGVNENNFNRLTPEQQDELKPLISTEAINEKVKDIWRYNFVANRVSARSTFNEYSLRGMGGYLPENPAFFHRDNFFCRARVGEGWMAHCDGSFLVNGDWDEDEKMQRIFDKTLKLDHPGIAKTLAFTFKFRHMQGGSADQGWVFVKEYFPGIPLKRAQEKYSITGEHYSYLARQCADIFISLVEQDIIYSSLNVDNDCMVNEEGQLKLVSVETLLEPNYPYATTCLYGYLLELIDLADKIKTPDFQKKVPAFKDESQKLFHSVDNRPPYEEFKEKLLKTLKNIKEELPQEEAPSFNDFSKYLELQDPSEGIESLKIS